MCYLYRHIRLDKNIPFYIGIGAEENYGRAYDKTERTLHWKNIVNKVGYKVEIMLDNLTWKEACEREKEFISLYGRQDKETGFLCNMTDGGEGGYGRIVSQETRLKQSLALSRIGHPMLGKHHTPEAIEKIRQASLNMDRTGIGEKISKGLKGKPKHINTLLNLKKGPLKQAKEVLNLETGIFYESMAHAANSINMMSHTLSRKLLGQRKNNTNFILI